MRLGCSRNIVPMPSKADIGRDHSCCMPSNLYRHPNLTYSFNYYGLIDLLKTPNKYERRRVSCPSRQNVASWTKKLSTTMHTSLRPPPLSLLHPLRGWRRWQHLRGGPPCRRRRSSSARGCWSSRTSCPSRRSCRWCWTRRRPSSSGS